MTDVRIIPIVPEPRVFTARASSWGGLFDCAYKWEGEHMLGMRNPSGLRAQLGTALHASTARFDAGRLAGADPVSVDDSAGVLVDTLEHPERDVDYSKDDITKRDAERIGLRLHSNYCNDMSPRYEFSSVEARLQPFDIDCGSGTIVRLTGSMDRARVAVAPAGPVIPDLKSGVRAVDASGVVPIKGRSAQLGTYQLMYEREHGTLTAGAQVIGLQTTEKARVAASPIFDAKRIMIGSDQVPGLIEIAALMFRSGLFPPNPSSILCSERYCARWQSCIYHE